MTALPEFPREVGVYLRTWDLIPDGALITTHSSWVLPVSGPDGPSMLKIARIPDERAGYRLMSWWNGDGAAKILEASDDALLMERAVGRLDLAQIARAGQDDQACLIVCKAAAKLHAHRSGALPELHRLDHWFQPLFDLSMSNQILAPAATTARLLLARPQEVGPLHGDLHHDNVLDFGDRGWLAIDPHGLIGERAFDFANIFTNPDLGDPAFPVATLPGRLEARLSIVTRETGIEADRLLDWIVAWTGLSASWFLADGDDLGAGIDLRVNAIARSIRDR